MNFCETLLAIPVFVLRKWKVQSLSFACHHWRGRFFIKGNVVCKRRGRVLVPTAASSSSSCHRHAVLVGDRLSLRVHWPRRGQRRRAVCSTSSLTRHGIRRSIVQQGRGRCSSSTSARRGSRGCGKKRRGGIGTRSRRSDPRVGHGLLQGHAFLWVESQQLLYEILCLRGDMRRERGDITSFDTFLQLIPLCPSKWKSAGQHDVQHATQRPQVRAECVVLTHQYFWCYIR